MASKNKVIEAIATIKTIYSYYAKDTDVEILVKTWMLLLKDIPDPVLEVAIVKCLQTCKVPPTPADVLEHVKDMEVSIQPSGESLWSTMVKALHKADELVYRFQFTFVEENGKTQGQNARDDFQLLWESLPETVKIYVGSPGEFMRMSRYTNDELKFEKARFLKGLPAINKRQEYAQYDLLTPREGGAPLLSGTKEDFDADYAYYGPPVYRKKEE